jgi:hypothetical protein
MAKKGKIDDNIDDDDGRIVVVITHINVFYR